MEDAWMISAALREAGNLAQAQGDYQQAARLFAESGALSEQQGLLNDLARARYNQGTVAILQGDHETGRAFLHRRNPP